MLNKLFPILGIALLSCNAEKQLQKAETRLSQAGRLPKICADRFPSRDSIVVKDSLITDTLLLGEYIFDTIRVNDTIHITKIVPSVKTVYKIMYKTVYKEKTDKIQSLQADLDKSRQDLAISNGKQTELLKEIQVIQNNLKAAQKEAKYRLWWLWIVICLCIGWTFRKFVKRIPFLQ